MPTQSWLNLLLTRLEYAALKQSLFLNLIIDDGKTFLNEILISSRQTVISRIATAVYFTRAVMNRRFHL